MFRAQSTLENSHLSSGFSWIKFQIILSWRVPVWTTTSFSVFSSFSFCFLHEKTLNLVEIEKKIGAAGSYCMDQSYFRILLLLVRKSKQSGFFKSEKSQPRPQGLLAIQYGGGRREDPGTQQKSRDWFVHGEWKFIQNGGQAKEWEDLGTRSWDLVKNNRRAFCMRMRESAEQQ